MSGSGPILVTGATGNVGRPLVAALLERGAAVRALSLDPAAARTSLAPRHSDTDGAAFAAARFDFADPASFVDAFAPSGDLPPRALFLLRPPAISDAGVINRALDAAVTAGVQHVVFLSIQGAERNPVVPHYAIERHLERVATARAECRYTLLRAAFFMQNLSTTHAADIHELGELIVPAGEGRTALVDVRDIAAAAAQVLTAANGVPYANRAYELTGREALTYDEVARVLTDVLARPVTYRRPSAIRFYRHMRARGHPRSYVAVMVALYTTARLGLAAHLSPELEQLLGRPPITFEQFARDHAAAWH